MIDWETVSAVRFGTGLPAVPGRPEEMLRRIEGKDTNARAFPVAPRARRLALARDYAEIRKRKRQKTLTEAEDKRLRKAFRKGVTEVLADDLRATLLRGAAGADPFRERLVWFWRNHFTVSGKSSPVHRLFIEEYVDSAIRPHVGGRFVDMLIAAETHPAMLFYLDQDASIGPNSPVGRRTGKGLNENLAREILELHTMGVGAPYSQDDVREFAELLTGLGIDPRGRTAFRRRRAEPGAEVVLGRRYGAPDGPEAIRSALVDIAHHPATARHLARKIAAHFIADTPPADLVEEMADAYLAGDTALVPVYRVLLDHPSARTLPGAKAKPPFDFIVSALRALGLDRKALAAMSPGKLRRLFVAPLSVMGQPWHRPTGPDGWPDSVDAWITPQGLAGRIQWAMSAPAALSPTLPPPAAFGERALGRLLRDDTRAALAQAPTSWEGVGIALAAPEFQTR